MAASRYVIVGGVGFLGVNLAAELSRRGEVIVPARPSSVRRRPRISGELERLGAKVVIADRLDAGFLRRLGGDVYYHAAGKLGGSMKDLEEAHVKLLGDVIDAAADVGARVVYVSSIGVAAEMRGVPRGSTVVEEDRHLDPSVFIHRGPYEVTKAMGERLLVSSGERLRGKWSIVRPSFLFGPWAYQPQWTLVLRAARLGLVLSAGSRNLVFTGDVARVLADAGAGLHDGRWVYVNAPYEADLSDVGLEICRQERRRCRKVSIGWAVSLLGALPSSPLFIARRMLKTKYRFASKYLGDFRFTGLEEAVSSFLRWAAEGLSP